MIILQCDSDFMKQLQVQCYSYPLIAYWINKHSPFLNNATQIHRVQRNNDLSDLVVLRKTIEVIDCVHQRFRSQLSVRQLSTKPLKLLLQRQSRKLFLSCKYTCCPS